MSDHLKHHKELDEKGEGKCSVPMWAGGLPNGFCDKVAYGFPEGRNGGYDLLQHVPFLACHMHGGPKQNLMVGSREVGEEKMEKSVKELLTEYFEYLDDRINKGEISFNRIQIYVTDGVHCFDESSAYLSVEDLEETASQIAFVAEIPDMSKEEYRRIFNLRPLSYKDCIMAGCLNFPCKFTTCNPRCGGFIDKEKYKTPIASKNN